MELNKKYSHWKNSERLYRIWDGIMQRTGNPYSKWYVDYGARGISICGDWADSYESFRDWSIANRYDDTLTIDRIDNNMSYCPENCRWVTRLVQSNNTRRNRYYTLENETHTIAEWSRITRIHYDTLYNRLINFGMGIKKAISEPVKRSGRGAHTPWEARP